MSLVNKIAIGFLLLLSFKTATAQLSAGAWRNYASSKYEQIDQHPEGDAIIIYDRTYYDVNTEPGTVLLQTTVHRKIKINSLYGLEQFNKLYISTFSDLNFNIEFVRCKVKILKANGSTVKTDESELITTTLPANAPFFYKKEGTVKMLALSNVSIGDEIEYIYSTRSIYQTTPFYFYKTDRVSFSNNYHQLEKSIFFESEKFETKIWPYNFDNGNDRNTDFSFKSGNKISLKNINPRARHPYTKYSLEEPYMYYILSATNKQDGEETWEKITQQFKATRKDIKGSEIYDGQNIQNALDDISEKSGTLNKFKLLLNRTNSLLEENFHLYENFENDIDVSWSYAEIISKMMQRLKIPVNFHFVVNKNYGKFDPSYVSIYQFDNIIISFRDDKGETHYMPLLEPYTELNEIKTDFRNTDCFTIHQSATGKRDFAFESIPASDLESSYDKEVIVNFKGPGEKGMLLEVEEVISFKGDAFIDIKPKLLHIANDSLAEKSFRTYIENQIVSIESVDSIYAIDYVNDNKKFDLSYKYLLASDISTEAPIINFRMDDFVANYFYTPLALREKINSTGYLYDEYGINYSVAFNIGDQYSWIENELLSDELDNSIGKINCTYEKSNANYKLSYSQVWKKEQFESTEWPKMLMLRDKSYDFLHGNLYFKKK